jgi:hypothetical protein
MGKTFTSAFAVCVLVASLPLACGDDEDDGGGDGGGKGGTAGASGGSAGAGARGGSAGAGATGGSSGAGATGGSAGRGGAGSGGTTGGTAGMGGAPEGGMGGVPDTGGMGGEGGSGTMMTLVERYCAAGAVANCINQANCVQYYEQIFTLAIGVDPACEGLLTALYECHLAAMPPNWMCIDNQPQYIGSACMAENSAANDAFCFDF